MIERKWAVLVNVRVDVTVTVNGFKTLVYFVFLVFPALVFLFPFLILHAPDIAP